MPAKTLTCFFEFIGYLLHEMLVNGTVAVSQEDTLADGTKVSLLTDISSQSLIGLDVPDILVDSEGPRLDVAHAAIVRVPPSKMVEVQLIDSPSNVQDAWRQATAT